MKASMTFVLLGVVATPLAMSTPADATMLGRAMSVWGAGNPLDGTPQSCYIETYGGVQANNPYGSGCPESERWEVSLPIDNTGSHTVAFSSNYFGAQGQGCGANVVGIDSVTIVSSAFVTGSSSIGGGYGTQQMNSVSVPTPGSLNGFGYLYFYCQGMSYNGDGGPSTIYGVTWNP